MKNTDFFVRMLFTTRLKSLYIGVSDSKSDKILKSENSIMSGESENIANWRLFCDEQAVIAAKQFTRECFRYWLSHQNELNAFESESGESLTATTSSYSDRGYVEMFVDMFLSCFQTHFNTEFQLHVEKSRQIVDEDYCAIISVPRTCPSHSSVTDHNTCNNG